MKSATKYNTTYLNLIIVLFAVTFLFSACERERVPGREDNGEILRKMEVEQIVAPDFHPLPDPGNNTRRLLPILQHYGQEEKLSVQITSPEGFARCGENVIVRGRIRGLEHPGGLRGAEETASSWWEILDTDHRARIQCDVDGSFAFAIPTLGLPEVFYLRVVAKGRGGQIVEQIIGLIAESSAPSGKEVPVVSEPSIPSPFEPSEEVPGEEEVPRVRNPVLTLDRPKDSEFFSSQLKVAGHLLDADGLAFSDEEIESVTWEVEGSTLNGRLELDEQGAFTTTIDAGAVRQDALLLVRAVAANGRIAERSVPLRADTEGPSLVIRTPRDGETYGATIDLQGSAGDEGPITLFCRIPGVQGLSEELSLQETGDFRFQIPSSGLEGIQVVELRAVDQLGNATVSTVTLSGRAQASEPVKPVAPTAREPLQPRLVIDSPENGAYYHSQIVVKGLLQDGDRIDWQIQESGLQGSGIIGRDGRFTLRIPSADLQGTQVLRLIAAGHAGRQVEKVLVLLDHEKGPEISITTPENRSYYRREIQFEGSVGNPKEAWDSVGEVAALSLEIPGREDASAEIPFDAQGHFRYLLPAEDFSGKLTVILAAEDRNGDLNRVVLTLLDGNLSPSVSITSPQIDQPYGAKLRVRGTIIDPYEESRAMGGIESVTYNVTSPQVFTLVRSIPQGEIELREDKSFDFVVTTRELSGPQDVNILVRARNGNQAKRSVRILEGEADIPVFSVETGDRRAVLRWDEVPSATGYSLRYRTANPGQRQGRETRIEGVGSPYVLTKLSNGSRYIFQVEAALPGEPDGFSAEKWAIPLSTDTLQPAVAGEFEQIRISWPSIPGSDRYAVWRSTSREGQYVQVAGALTNTNYLDRDVQYGHSYFYRVTPESVPEFPSSPVRGQSTAFPLEKLKLTGFCSLNHAQAITLFGGYAFVANGMEGIKIVDISAPDSPTVVGGFQTADARDVAVLGEYAFVADGERGLKVLDVSDPRYPSQIGMRKTMDARAVALDGDAVFVADGTSGLKIIDVSSPVQPTRIGSVTTDNARDLVVQDGKLYLADGRGGLRIFEINDSAELIEEAHLLQEEVHALAVQGSLLYLAAGNGGLIIVDYSTGQQPVELGRYRGGEILDVRVSGTFAYVVDSREGMIVIDVSDPQRPWRFAGFPSENVAAVSVRGQYAYLATASGLQVIHILIQGHSVPVSSARTGGKAFELSVSGPRAYVACHDQGIRIVDISDPGGLGDESVIGAWSGEYSMGIEVADSIAFVASGRRGLSILDLSPLQDDDPATQPHRIGSYYTGGTAHRTVLQRDLLFVADGPEGLKILDVSITNNPVEIGSLPSPDARDVALLPGFALVADGEVGLIVCDAADPGNPTAVTTVDPPGVQRIAVQDNLVACAGKAGIGLYDFSDPRRPVLVGRFESRYVEGMFISGRYLYVAEGYRGLTVVDIRSFDRPVRVSACPEIYAADVVAGDGYAIVTDSREIHAIQVLIPAWLSQGSSLR